MTDEFVLGHSGRWRVTLPVEVATEAVAILAQRGKGKTSTGVLITENLVAAGVPVVVLDPTGAWWGLKSSADGKRDGLPVVIFGGEHQEVPLEETAGKLVAQVLVDTRTPAVLDLSTMSKAAMRRFVADFLEELYTRNREPLHLMVDEADSFAPQRLRPDMARLFGAMDEVVRRGRIRGLGVTLICQRPAALNKDVLSQISTLVVLGMTGTHDIKAIDEWVQGHSDPDEARQVKQTLSSLDVGEGWLWSPAWLGVLKRLKILPRNTFDSSRTPRVGEKRVEPQRMAEVDLEALGEQIAATRERAKADDPKELRRRIRALEQMEVQTREVVRVEHVRVPNLTPEAAEHLANLFKDLHKAIQQMVEDAGSILIRAQEAITKAMKDQDDFTVVPPRIDPPKVEVKLPQLQTRPALRSVPPAPSPLQPAEMGLSSGAVRVLEVFSESWPARFTRTQVASLSSYKESGGAFQKTWKEVLATGWISSGTDSLWELSDDGVRALGVDTTALHDPDAELARWMQVLPARAKQVLELLRQHSGEGLEKAWIAEVIGMTATGGAFSGALTPLIQNGLAERQGTFYQIAERFR